MRPFCRRRKLRFAIAPHITRLRPNPPMSCTIHLPPARGRSLGLMGACALWACAVGAGFWIVTNDELLPARSAPAAIVWPAASNLREAPDRFTLVAFFHPRCPCSRASLAELARIMEHHTDRVGGHVLFTVPPDAGPEWTDTGMASSATAIPGLVVANDVGGREASLFGAAASGHVLLYDAQGRLLFSGGVTAARGHFGPNPSSDRLIALITASVSAATATPVYGCPLCLSPEVCETTRCKR